MTSGLWWVGLVILVCIDWWLTHTPQMPPMAHYVDIASFAGLSLICTALYVVVGLLMLLTPTEGGE